MTDPLILAEHSATLGGFLGPLRDAGYAAELLDASDELELPTLVVRLDDDGRGRRRHLTVNLMPLDFEDDVEISLAQMYVPLPFSVDEDHRSEFGRFALEANTMLPAGGMGARDNGEVYLRYMLATPTDSVPQGSTVAELVSLLEYQADVFGEAMESVATGDTTADAAIAGLPGIG